MPFDLVHRKYILSGVTSKLYDTNIVPLLGKVVYVSEVIIHKKF